MGYSRQVASAKKMIASKGQLVTWRVIRDVPNPAEPWKPSVPGVFAEHQVSICFLPINKETRETVAFIKGTEVQMSCEMGLMAQVAFTPSSSDVVIRNGEELHIDSMQILRPDGEPLLYTLVFK